MSDPMRTLIVDDEASIRFFLSQTLRRAGHEVKEAATGEAALAVLRDTPVDLALLDLKLGGRVDGLRLLEAIRWRWPAAIVIILTAHGSLDSALTAIREGVDGYLLKPAESEEILQTIQEAIDRRRRGEPSAEGKAEPPTGVLSYGSITIDPDRYLVTLNGEPVTLTPSEFKLLHYLMEHSGRVLAPMELVRVVQGYDADYPYEARQIIKWYVHRLRSKIEPDPAHPRYILNVRGVGYTFGERAET